MYEKELSLVKEARESAMLLTQQPMYAEQEREYNLKHALADAVERLVKESGDDKVQHAITKGFWAAEKDLREDTQSERDALRAKLQDHDVKNSVLVTEVNTLVKENRALLAKLQVALQVATEALRAISDLEGNPECDRDSDAVEFALKISREALAALATIKQPEGDK